MNNEITCAYCANGVTEVHKHQKYICANCGDEVNMVSDFRHWCGACLILANILPVLKGL